MSFNGFETEVDSHRLQISSGQSSLLPRLVPLQLYVALERTLISTSSVT